jgi:hypothetical protein
MTQTFIYVVKGSDGNSVEGWDWNICAFLDQTEAELYALKAQERLAELYQEYNAKYKEYQNAMDAWRKKYLKRKDNAEISLESMPRQPDQPVNEYDIPDGGSSSRTTEYIVEPLELKNLTL